MADLFYMGGPIFMGILTIIFICAIAIAIYIFLQTGKEGSKKLPVSMIKEIGIFGLVVGIFAQFIGLFEAFKAIEELGSVSPALLIGGLKVSSVTTLYGFVIFLTAYLLYFWLTTIRREA